jgi:hypothetical protein
MQSKIGYHRVFNLKYLKRYTRDSAEFFALRKLSFVSRGYNEKESHKLVMKEYAQKKVELEYEKETAARQSEVEGMYISHIMINKKVEKEKQQQYL